MPERIRIAENETGDFERAGRRDEGDEKRAEQLNLPVSSRPVWGFFASIGLTLSFSESSTDAPAASARSAVEAFTASSDDVSCSCPVELRGSDLATIVVDVEKSPLVFT